MAGFKFRWLLSSKLCTRACFSNARMLVVQEEVNGGREKCRGQIEMHRLPLVLMEGGSHIAADSGMLVRMDLKQSGQEKCKETQMESESI